MSSELQLRTGENIAFEWGEGVREVSSWLHSDPNTNDKLPAAVQQDIANGRGFLAVIAGRVVGHVALRRFPYPVELPVGLQIDSEPITAAHWGISELVVDPNLGSDGTDSKVVGMISRIAIAGSAFYSPVFPPARYMVVSAITADEASRTAFKKEGFRAAPDPMVADAHGYGPERPLEVWQEAMAKVARVPWSPTDLDLL